MMPPRILASGPKPCGGKNSQRIDHYLPCSKEVNEDLTIKFFIFKVADLDHLTLVSWAAIMQRLTAGHGKQCWSPLPAGSSAEGHWWIPCGL